MVKLDGAPGVQGALASTSISRALAGRRSVGTVSIRLGSSSTTWRLRAVPLLGSNRAIVGGTLSNSQ